MQKIISDIFASKQSEKILTGLITSIEPVKISGEVEKSAIIVYEGYKVILPVSKLGVRDDIRVLRSLIGAEIDFIVTGISEQRKIAVASRVKAMELKRKLNANKDLEGQVIRAKVTGIGKSAIYVEAFGVETTIPKQEVDYGYINNLRDYTQIGEVVKCKVRAADIQNGVLELSMKDLKENPYDNLQDIFAIHSEHLGTITNVQPYGIFLTFDQYPKISVLCPVPKWNNFMPSIKDKYVVRIKKISDSKINGNLIRLVKRSEE